MAKWLRGICVSVAARVPDDAHAACLVCMFKTEFVVFLSGWHFLSACFICLLLSPPPT